MKLGGFGRVADYLPMQRAGYDYAELDMPELEEMQEGDFLKFREETQKAGLPVQTGARILPIVTPTFFVDGFRPADLAPYLKKSCARAGALGIQTVIFGNGKARWLQTPDDLRREPVFVELLRMMAEIAGENGQELLLEPLGPRYSNYLNTIPQAVEVIRRTDMPNLFTMADLRHMVWSGEPLDDLSTYQTYIHHIHVDEPRSFPQRGYPHIGDGYDYADFVQALTASGYDGTLTIEADRPEDWKAAHDGAMAVLGDLFRPGKQI